MIERDVNKRAKKGLYKLLVPVNLQVVIELMKWQFRNYKPEFVLEPFNIAIDI